ncbi:MAG TPA: PepSY-associated TM helix domain-containing protein [Gemmatimonadaceae bacterium]|nr:PepSY-associated TM helix domain-containing protein [Gemmatimonadaceae bacterium]
MRKTLIVIHRWTALIVGIILLGTALSGASLVFEGAIDRGLHPELWRVAPGPGTLPIDSVVARVEARFPGEKIASISLSPEPDRAWVTNAGKVTVYVDPFTGGINGTRTLAEGQNSLSRRLHVFHVELFAGKIGRTIVGTATVIALFLVLTGIIIWWPDKLIRINTGASWKRINFDLHHALGIVAALVLIVITTSGLVIHYDVLTKAVRSLDATSAAAAPQQPPAPDGARVASFDTLAAAARGALPGANIMFISTGGAKHPATVAMRFPEDRTPGGRSRVFIDRYTGAVLGKLSTREAQLGTRIDNLKRSLHTGDVLGKPTEIIWLLAALVMASQVLTGFLMWWNARRARGSARSARAGTP